MAVTNKLQLIKCPACGWTLLRLYHGLGELQCPGCKCRVILDYDGAAPPTIRVKGGK